MEWNIVKLEAIGSTNTYIDQIDVADSLSEGYVVVAHSQTAGRGQRGNSWEAAPGKNLTFSYLLRPHDVVAHEQFILSQAVALAVVDVLSRYADGFSVKWPNDIYYCDKKIAGILIEHNLTGSHISRTIVGIGLNINQASFVSDAPNPVSLLQIMGREYDLDEVLSAILQATAMRYAMCNDDREGLRQAYANVLYRREGYYRYRDADGEFEAAIRDVRPDGYLLLVDRAGREREYAFKEVAFVI
ncbi:MAG: biotin--[Bacteroidaceae bacterium]|nr:biotin--[acetyl-CoA-carboxylase] ligase [Bacteroidales bacterium]MBQ2979287.1 biotin--[acetyl-CoA-carboxylase] ligase [Bacteroidaceae bacterium]